MGYLKLAHDLVDGLSNGDHAAVAAACGLIFLAALSGYATTMLTKWGTKKGWQGVKWLITPKPMEGLAKTLLEALERGEKTVQGWGLYVGEQISFGAPSQNARPNSIYVYDRPHTEKKAEWTKVDGLLSRRDRRYLCWLAGWYRDCIRKDMDAATRKQAWVKGMEVAESIAHPTVAFDEAEDKCPSAWGAPQPCRCNPQTDETCNTCTGEAKECPRDYESNLNGHPATIVGKDKSCNCPDCRASRQTKWKRDV